MEVIYQETLHHYSRCRPRCLQKRAKKTANCQILRPWKQQCNWKAWDEYLQVDYYTTYSIPIFNPDTNNLKVCSKCILPLRLRTSCHILLQYKQDQLTSHMCFSCQDCPNCLVPPLWWHARAAGKADNAATRDRCACTQPGSACKTWMTDIYGTTLRKPTWISWAWNWGPNTCAHGSTTGWMISSWQSAHSQSYVADMDLEKLDMFVHPAPNTWMDLTHSTFSKHLCILFI